MTATRKTLKKPRIAKTAARPDKVAKALSGEDVLGIVEKVVKKNGLEKAQRRWKKNKANAGSQRMALGNILRGRIRRGEEVRL